VEQLYVGAFLGLTFSGRSKQRSYKISFSKKWLQKNTGILFSVIPAKAGIQSFQKFMPDLDPGFRRGDDFQRTQFY